MKKIVLAASAAALALAAAASANAAISVAATEVDNLNGPLLYGQVMLDNFDNILNPNVSYSGNVITPQNPVSNSASPPYSGGVTICCANGNPYVADATKYASVQGASSGTFSLDPGKFLTSFSFYMGSPDTYNTVVFHVAGGPDETFQGSAIWGGDSVYAGGGDRTKGYRVYYNFGGAKVSSITFSSGQDAFEFDGLAGNAVPEPATWGLMILGFGGAGAMLRSRRRAVA